MNEPGSGSGGPSPMRFVGIGFELIVPILLGMYLGYRLDLWLGTGPWWMVGLGVLGIVTGFVQFFRSVLPARRDGGDGPSGGSRP